MKKRSLILFLLMVLSFSVFAQVDVKSMSEEELRSAKSKIEKELTVREGQRMENSTDRIMIPLDNLDFEANDDFTEVTITGFHNDYDLFRDKIIEIPSEIQGLPVTKIHSGIKYSYYGDREDWYLYNGNSIFRYTNAEGVYIPDSVKIIGAGAFGGSSIRKIRLSNNLEKIGNGAFRSSNLENIELPENLTWIGESAFSFTNIKSLTLPKTLQCIGSDAFGYCDELETVEIPEGFSCKANYWSEKEATLSDIIDGTKIRKNFALVKKLKSIKLDFLQYYK